MGTLGDGRAVCTTKSCSTARPSATSQRWQRSVDRGDGDRHLDRIERSPSSSRIFDLLCSDVDTVPLSRAAAASSAVPLVLSPVTLNNYGGSCGFKFPSWAQAIGTAKSDSRGRREGRLQRYKEMKSFQDSGSRPYIHLVDGGARRQPRHARRCSRSWKSSRALARNGAANEARPGSTHRGFRGQFAVGARRRTGTSRARPPNDIRDPAKGYRRSRSTATRTKRWSF